MAEKRRQPADVKITILVYRGAQNLPTVLEIIVKIIRSAAEK
jgi:hypothetical protein